MPKANDGPPPPAIFLRFTTQEFSGSIALDAWRDFFGGALMRVEMQPRPSGPFYGAAQIISLPNVTVGFISSSSNRFVRESALANDGNEHFLLVIATSGSVGVTAGEEGRPLVAGEACLIACGDRSDPIITYDKMLGTGEPVRLGLMFSTASSFDVNLFSDDATHFELYEVKQPTIRNPVGSFSIALIPKRDLGNDDCRLRHDGRRRCSNDRSREKMWRQCRSRQCCAVSPNHCSTKGGNASAGDRCRCIVAVPDYTGFSAIAVSFPQRRTLAEPSGRSLAAFAHAFAFAWCSRIDGAGRSALPLK